MRRTSKEMYPLLRQYEDSGLSKSKFCKLHRLNQATFWYWWSKYQKSRSNKFVEVNELAAARPSIELHLGAGKLIFSELPPVDYLRSLCNK